MYQTIGEEILIIGIYQKGRFTPKKIQWRKNTLVINQICSVHDFKDGAVRKRRFSVMSGTTLYLIEFDRDRETWLLEQVWVE